MNRCNWLAAGLAVMLLSACSSQKAPAEQAIARMDNTMSAIHDSAARYAPDTLQAVEAQVAAIKQSYARGDYAGVLAAAPGVNTAIANLRQDAGAKQSAVDAEAAKV